MATALMIRLNCVKLGYTRDQLIISTILDLSSDKIDKWIFLQIHTYRALGLVYIKIILLIPRI